jgi:DNA-binding winged helix-turn-helix (wHTH) protein/TolB-like protein
VSKPKQYAWGEWRFEPVEYRLTRHGEQVMLPVKTLDLLALLISRAPRLATKAEILNTVWPDAAVEEGNIAFHVATLRKTLDREGEPTCIETVRGRGYRFVAELMVAPVVAPPSTTHLELPPAVKAIAGASLPPARRRRLAWIAAAVIAAAIVVTAAQAIKPDPVLITPFAVTDPQAGDEVFAESLAQFVVVTLSQAGVPALTRSGGPEGETARAAAQRLGAERLLTGTMTLNSERRWEVSVRLLRADDGRSDWSWRFVAPYNEHRHQLQEQIAKRVAAGLQLRRDQLAQRTPAATSP